MEPGTGLIVVIVATVVFVLVVLFLLRRFKEVNAGKYPPPTEGKNFEIRRSPR